MYAVVRLGDACRVAGLETSNVENFAIVVALLGGNKTSALSLFEPQQEQNTLHVTVASQSQ